MFATCRWTVCWLSTSDEAISRFERPEATRRSTSVLPRESGESPFGGRDGCLVEEARERAVDVALVVHPGQVRVPRERHEPRVRQLRRELASAPDRHGAVAPSVEHERRHRHSRQPGARVGGEIELEEGGRDLRVRRAALVAGEGVDLVAAAVRELEAREHLRGERPVGPDEEDERVAGRLAGCRCERRSRRRTRPCAPARGRSSRSASRPALRRSTRRASPARRRTRRRRLPALCTSDSTVGGLPGGGGRRDRRRCGRSERRDASGRAPRRSAAPRVSSHSSSRCVTQRPPKTSGGPSPTVAYAMPRSRRPP